MHMLIFHPHPPRKVKSVNCIVLLEKPPPTHASQSRFLETDRVVMQIAMETTKLAVCSQAMGRAPQKGRENHRLL